MIIGAQYASMCTYCSHRLPGAKLDGLRAALEHYLTGAPTGATRGGRHQCLVTGRQLHRNVHHLVRNIAVRISDRNLRSIPAQYDAMQASRHAHGVSHAYLHCDRQRRLCRVGLASIGALHG